VSLDIDVIIDADAAYAPLGEHIRLARQWLERRAVELFEQLSTRAAETADWSLFVERFEQLIDRRVQIGQTVELSMAQPRQDPSLDDEHRRLDLGFVARPAWPGRQDGGAVMRRHLGIGSVDLRLVQAGLDDGDLGVVRDEKTRHTVDGCKGTRVGADPIGKPLRPGRLGVGEVRRPHDGDEDLRLTHLAGQPINDHRHGGTGIVDEQLVATQMGLPHRDRELAFPAAVQFAEARIAVALGIALDVLVPEKR
jgi:hypothetical protein